VLDVREIVQVVGKSLRESRVLRMGPGIIPPNPLVSPEDSVTIVADLPHLKI